MIFVISGVAGAGKTTIGKLLSDATGVPFFDADDFHPASNIAKMKGGVPLNDEDRQPWLETLARRLSAWAKEGGAVLACSVLKETYRETLRSQCDEKIHWVTLQASEAVLGERLEGREGHFFDKQLLRSQLDAFEEPDYGWLIDAESSPQKIVNNILERLRGK